MQTRQEIVSILDRWGVQWQQWPASPGEKVYRLVGVREVGHLEIKVRLEDQDRQAIDGVPVLFYYPEDYPDELSINSYKWTPPFSTGDVVIADDGLAKMVMSGDWKVGDFHRGATRRIDTAVLVADPEVPSDVLKSVGMLVGGPDDKAHAALRFTFQLFDPDYVPLEQRYEALHAHVFELTERVESLEQQALTK
jgi:hypothetical protein